jgi:hypothetical protein
MQTLSVKWTINRYICYLLKRHQDLIKQERFEDAAVILIERESFEESVVNKSDFLCARACEGYLKEIIYYHE